MPVRYCITVIYIFTTMNFKAETKRFYCTEILLLFGEIVKALSLQSPEFYGRI